tara:strand:+ start:1251 stop:1694 length:444 start_codon:yes stop_codon:yes gene_type:complete
MNNTHKWTPCGLNADWCIQSWHYGTNQPNSVDGDYYVLDNEDGKFLVARYFPSKEEDCVTTIASFPTKAEAIAMVERSFSDHPLQAEYDAWLKDNIPADWLKNPKQDLSAENIMAYINAENDEFSITQAQYDWLADFCKRWDAIENS